MPRSSSSAETVGRRGRSRGGGIVAGIVAATLSLTASAADAPPGVPTTPRNWPRLRGADAAGQGGERRFPSSFGVGDIAWTAELPGAGHASPAVWEGRVYVASATADPADAGACLRMLSCHDAATGALRWQRVLPGPVEPINAMNSLASSSPVADCDGVYWLWATRDNLRAEAFTHDGVPRWHADLGPMNSDHGFGGSPTLWRDSLVVPMEQDGPSAVVALDTATGRERWRLPRDTARTAYAPALLLADGTARADGGTATLVLASMAHGLSGVDPATGRVLWERRCLPKRAVSCPVAVARDEDGTPIVVGTSGDGGGDNLLVAVRVPREAPPDGAGPLEPEEVYSLDRSAAPYVPAPLPSGERLYLWGDRGVVTCVTAATGEIRWRGRVGGTFSASPVAVGGTILNVSIDGDVIVLADGDSFEELGRTALGEECRASPAVADGRIYIRSVSRLRALAAEPK